MTIRSKFYKLNKLTGKKKKIKNTNKKKKTPPQTPRFNRNMFNVKDYAWAGTTGYSAVCGKKPNKPRAHNGSQVEHDSTVSFCLKGGRHHTEKGNPIRIASKMCNNSSALVSSGQRIPAEALLALGTAFQKWYRPIWEHPRQWKSSEAQETSSAESQDMRAVQPVQEPFL